MLIHCVYQIGAVQLDYVNASAMLIHITVKPGQHQDRLWRQGDGLMVHITAPPVDGQANIHMVRYLAERLNVPQSLIEITDGKTSPHKTIWVKIPYADMVSRIKRLDELPQASLFDGS